MATDPLKNRTISVLILIALLTILVAVCLKNPETIHSKLDKRIATQKTQISGMTDYLEAKLGALFSADAIIENQIATIIEIQSRDIDQFATHLKQYNAFKTWFDGWSVQEQETLRKSVERIEALEETVNRLTKENEAFKNQKPTVIVKKYYCCPCK